MFAFLRTLNTVKEVMCRMFGMAAEAPISLYEVLCAAPRSLCALSNEHADGWGIAMHDGTAWSIEREVTRAAASARYPEVAARSTRLAIAHVRKKTVGGTSLANTHPFTRDGYVFAHNGTVDLAAVSALAAPEFLADIDGETDSERLFAVIRTHVASAASIELGVRAAVRRIAGIGTANFLFSCGAQLYAYRQGRSLFAFARGGATLIASEPLGDDWYELSEGALVIVHQTAATSIAA